MEGSPDIDVQLVGSGPYKINVTASASNESLFNLMPNTAGEEEPRDTKPKK